MKRDAGGWGGSQDEVVSGDHVRGAESSRWPLREDVLHARASLFLPPSVSFSPSLPLFTLRAVGPHAWVLAGAERFVSPNILNTPEWARVGRDWACVFLSVSAAFISLCLCIYTRLKACHDLQVMEEERMCTSCKVNSFINMLKKGKVSVNIYLTFLIWGRSGWVKATGFALEILKTVSPLICKASSGQPLLPRQDLHHWELSQTSFLVCFGFWHISSTPLGRGDGVGGGLIFLFSLSLFSLTQKSSPPDV